MTTVAARETPADAIDWERLWLSTLRRAWTSLALIPIGGDVSAARLATKLAEVGRRHCGTAITVTDATGVTLGDLEAELGKLAARAGCTERAIVALPRLLRSPAGVALAQAADAVILCVALGSSAIAEAEQILAEVGRERVIGSVVVHRG
jgi:hypothetical protein